ncbi:MAG: M3 family metallopeptidase [Neisseriaceae bacterium]
MNKLLSDFKLMPYGNFTILELGEAIDESLKSAWDTLNDVLAQTTVSWEHTIEPLHTKIYNLNRLWGELNHLMSVADSDEIRNLYDKLQGKITDFYVNLGQNQQLYEKYNNIKENSYDKITKEQQRVLDNEFRDFYLSGINLPKDEQLKFKQIQNDLDKITTKFAQNVLDSTDASVKYVTLADLPDVPDDILFMYHEEAKRDGKDNLYKITLHTSSYLPIMQYCSNQKLREELYKEYVTRASEFNDGKFDNSKLIQEILNLRLQKAKLLKFNNYSELSLYTKMADNNKQVLEFLYELANKSRPYAIKDVEELKNFALEKFGVSEVFSWDMSFFSEKLQQEKYSYSTQELKKYFQLPVVLEGLFKLINNLYKIELIHNVELPIWNPDVQAFDVVKDGNVIGNLFLDLYSRNGKLQGAWMHSAQDKYNTGAINFNPVAYVICNFTNPIGNEPSLLTFDDVQTIFHEMGHALHHLLTKITNYSISGINGVEWDAVELPSQFMEYFAWNYDILKEISKHVETNESIPLKLYNKLLASRYYQAGLQTLRQLEFAIYDMLLHSTDNVLSISYMNLLGKVREEIAVIIPPEYNRFPHSFTHIFSGGYAAGYYSYKWAEVLATDIFSVFDNQNKEKLSELGNKFLKTILSQGGVNPMMDNFKAFMSREPQIDALLKYSFGEISAH